MMNASRPWLVVGMVVLFALVGAGVGAAPKEEGKRERGGGKGGAKGAPGPGKDGGRGASKRPARVLTEEQRRVIVETIHGTIPEVCMVVARDTESERYALQLEGALKEAGVKKLHRFKLPAGQTLPSPFGLMMYKPEPKAGISHPSGDPLFEALRASGNPYVGATEQPYAAFGPTLPAELLPINTYTVFVGPKFQ